MVPLIYGSDWDGAQGRVGICERPDRRSDSGHGQWRDPELEARGPRQRPVRYDVTEASRRERRAPRRNFVAERKTKDRRPPRRPERLQRHRLGLSSDGSDDGCCAAQTTAGRGPRTALQCLRRCEAGAKGDSARAVRSSPRLCRTRSAQSWRRSTCRPLYARKPSARAIAAFRILARILP